MTQSTNKFEQLLELLINEENEKAEQMFHEIVVEKSRDIYENLVDSEATATTETKEEAKEEDNKEDKKEEDKKEEVTEKKDEDKEDAKEDAKEDDKKDEGLILQRPTAIQPQLKVPAQKSDEESVEEIGGDATDQLVKDIASDEEGEVDAAADELGQDMDADGEENGEEGDPEERIADLEDALEELKAEFEKMLAGANGEEEVGAEEQALAPVIPGQETQPEMSRFEGKDAKEDAKAEKKETVKEYKIKKSADNADHADKSAKSPVATKGGAKSGANPIKTGSGAEDKGRAAPTAQKMGSFENSPGKDKGTSFKKEVKADKKDSSDKSAKSPVAGGK